jgi:spore germination protein YaaH
MRRAIFVLLFLLATLVVPQVSAAAARSLALGLSGSDVTVLQQELIAHGYLSTAATGYFGPATQAAVEKFQCDHDVACAGQTGYGVAGPQTQALLAAPAQSGTLSGALTPKATGAFEVGGWVPYWRVATATADVTPHLSQLTSVMPFSYSISSSGQLVDSANLSSTSWQGFVAMARAQKVRVVPTVLWGDGTAIQNVLSNSAARISLENQIASAVKQNGFDGIDIDFEAKEAQTINYFSTFLKGLYERMGQKWVYCTVEARMPIVDRYSQGAAIPPDATDYANDYAALSAYCDRVELMAYDQGTADVRLDAARMAPYAPVADPGWVEDIVSLASQSIPRNKLILGIPTYGYEYQVTPQGGGGYQYQVLWPFNPGYATGLATQLDVTPARTSAGELGFTYMPNAGSSVALAAGPGFSFTQSQQSLPSTTVAQNLGSQAAPAAPFHYVTWSDAQAIKDKVTLAKQLGLRGVALFSFSGGEDPAMWGVLP